MPQFLITAYDGTDAAAADRRMSVRPAHLANVKPMVEDGRLLAGGAILNDAGAMIGSTCITEFPDRAALDHWLATDPYVTGGVWQKIAVQPFRVAVMARPKS
jgi:uncharacterized protein YciI